jgi:hypothetical protein
MPPETYVPRGIVIDVGDVPALRTGRIRWIFSSVALSPSLSWDFLA